MTHRIRSIAARLVAPSLVLLLLFGCGALGGSTLPSTVLIKLPDGTTAEVEQGAGVASLADSSWQLFRTAGTVQGAAFLTISFGPEGNLRAFENNTIAPEIFGSTIYFDGKIHNTPQAGVTYTASAYGAQTSDGSGVAFEARMTAFAAGLQAGYATVTPTGTFDPEDPDTMTGTFAFTTEVTLFSMPEANQDDEWLFIAHRVVE